MTELHDDAIETGRQVEVTLQSVPNTILRPNARPHFFAKNKAAQKLRELSAWSARLMPLDQLSAPVSLHYHVRWPKGRKLVDLDAVPVMCKAALDGLVDAGVLSDDGPKIITRISASQGKALDRIGSMTLTLTEIDPVEARQMEVSV